MKNWPRNELSILEEASLSITKKLFQFSTRKKNKDSKLWSYIRQSANYHNNTINKFNIDISDFEQEIMLSNIVYYDIYPVEEYENLKNGLTGLLNSYQWPKDSLAYIIERRSNHSDFIDKSRENPSLFGNTSVSSIYLENKFKYHKHIRFSLSSISSSYICLIMASKPSELLINQHYNISRELSEIDSQIGFPNIKYGLGNIKNWHRFGFSNKNNILVKKRMLDELYLDANKELTKIIRKYIGAGLALEGPLPQIEIQKINQPISSFIVNKRKSKVDINDIDTKTRSYLSAIGYEEYSTSLYKDKWLVFFKTKRSEHYSMKSHQLIISEPDYKTDNPKETENIDESIHNHLQYWYPSLCSLLSVQMYLLNIQIKLVEFRNQFFPLLKKESLKGISIRGFNKGIARTAEINWLEFQQNRIWTEFLENDKLSYLKRDLQNLKRNSLKKESKNGFVKFTEDLESIITHLKNKNSEQILLMNKAINQIISLKNILLNKKLQIILIILTISLLFLSLLLLPSSYIDIILNKF